MFCDTENAEVIRYASTRWLGLERCFNRELQKYVALESYVKSEGLSDARFKRLEAAFNDCLTELYLLFYQAVLPVFTTFNKMLQSEEPLIYLLYKCQQRFMNNLASKFVKPDIIRTLKEANKSFSELGISIENQKEDKNLFIRFITRNQLYDQINSGEKERKIDSFFDGVSEFYSTAYKYCKKWLPLDDDFPKHCKFIDFESRSEVSFDDVQVLAQKFTITRNNNLVDPEKFDELEEEFLTYQGIADKEIPGYVWEEALVRSDNDKSYHRMDVIWAHLRAILPNLSDVALTVLTVPYSNAAEERVFSIIRKNKTEFLSRLDVTSLNAIMVVKMSTPESLLPCYRWKPTKELLKACKKACTEEFLRFCLRLYTCF